MKNFKDFTKMDFHGYSGSIRFDYESIYTDSSRDENTLPLIGQFEIKDWFGDTNVKFVDVIVDKKGIQVIPLGEPIDEIIGVNLKHNFNKKLAGRLAGVIFGSAPVTSDELLSLGFHTM